MDKLTKRFHEAKNIRKKREAIEAQWKRTKELQAAKREGEHTSQLMVYASKDVSKAVLNEAARHLGRELAKVVSEEVPFSILAKVAEEYWSRMKYSCVELGRDRIEIGYMLDYVKQNLQLKVDIPPMSINYLVPRYEFGLDNQSLRSSIG